MQEGLNVFKKGNLSLKQLKLRKKRKLNIYRFDKWKKYEKFD